MFNLSRSFKGIFNAASNATAGQAKQIQKEQNEAKRQQQRQVDHGRFASRDPRHAASMNKTATANASKVKYLLPVSLAFVIISAITVTIQSQKKNEKGAVCVDCDRQREIAEEIYFNKKVPKEKGASMMGTRVG